MAHQKVTTITYEYDDTNRLVTKRTVETEHRDIAAPTMPIWPQVYPSWQQPQYTVTSTSGYAQTFNGDGSVSN